MTHLLQVRLSERALFSSAPHGTSTRQTSRALLATPCLTAQARALHSCCPQQAADMTVLSLSASGPRSPRGILSLYKEGIRSPNTRASFDDNNYYYSNKLFTLTTVLCQIIHNLALKLITISRAKINSLF